MLEGLVLKLVSGSGAISLLLCPAAPSYVQCPMTEKKELRKPLNLSEVRATACSIVVEHKSDNMEGAAVMTLKL